MHTSKRESGAGTLSPCTKMPLSFLILFSSFVDKFWVHLGDLQLVLIGFVYSTPLALLERVSASFNALHTARQLIVILFLE